MVAIFFVAFSLTPLTLARAQLPALGDDSTMSLAAERQLGDRIAREIYRDPDYVDDPLLTEYVQGIWAPLVASAKARGDLTPELDERFAWELMLARDRSVNAFALPGGYLGVHLGLIAVVTSRDELASVLAHELTHVTQRHISRSMGQQARQAPLVMAAMLLGMLAANKSPQAANALIAGGQAASVQSQLNFSRDMEREADRIGFGVMTQAGFEPAGFVGMFEKLEYAARLNDNGAFPYLRSHPMTTERIADAQARLPLGERIILPVLTLPHAMMAARARVFSTPSRDQLHNLVAEATVPALASAPAARQAGVLYAAVLAQIRLNETPAAPPLLARLTALTRSDAEASRYANLLAVELAIASGDLVRAGLLLDTGATARPERLLAADLLTRTGQAARVAPGLLDWVLQHPRDALAWQKLSAAQAAQGQMLRAIRSDGEARMAWMDYSGAIDRFKAAQDWSRKAGAATDHIEASVVDTRLREATSLLRQQAAER